MQDNLINILEKLGLTEKEARVYLACVSLGEAPVSKLCNIAQINRITTYDILDKLKKKGFITYFTRKKIRYFAAVKPEIIVEEFEKRMSDFKGALPKFKNLSKGETTPQIRSFDGIDGIKIIFTETLGFEGEITAFINLPDLEKIWPEFEKEYSKKRAKKNIYLRQISVDQKKPEAIKQEDGRFFRETRTLPEGFPLFYSIVIVFGNSLALISLKGESFGIIITNEEMAKSFKAFFEMVWQFVRGGSFESGDDIKRKLFSPLTPAELNRSISEMSKPLSHDRKEIKEDNMSLF